MTRTFKANEIESGYHPSGYKIDKTAPPMDFYTKWKIDDTGEWHDPVPVCFDSMPAEGWYKYEGSSKG
ncbi:MAG: hypothetical protein JW913_00350 [Chitinispirillaceae bacterium]|nr:hypothetical protein [Chitinispirillaceae bacterium]